MFALLLNIAIFVVLAGALAFGELLLAAGLWAALSNRSGTAIANVSTPMCWLVAAMGVAIFVVAAIPLIAMVMR